MSNTVIEKKDNEPTRVSNDSEVNEFQEVVVTDRFYT